MSTVSSSLIHPLRARRARRRAKERNAFDLGVEADRLGLYRPRRQPTLVKAFSVERGDDPSAVEVHYTSDSDLIAHLKTTELASSGSVDGGAVLVLLDVDGESYGTVHAEGRASVPEVQVLELAIRHLTTARDQLKRLSR